MNTKTDISLKYIINNRPSHNPSPKSKFDIPENKNLRSKADTEKIKNKRMDNDHLAKTMIEVNVRSFDDSIKLRNSPSNSCIYNNGFKSQDPLQQIPLEKSQASCFKTVNCDKVTSRSSDRNKSNKFLNPEKIGKRITKVKSSDRHDKLSISLNSSKYKTTPKLISIYLNQNSPTMTKKPKNVRKQVDFDKKFYNKSYRSTRLKTSSNIIEKASKYDTRFDTLDCCVYGTNAANEKHFKTFLTADLSSEIDIYSKIDLENTSNINKENFSSHSVERKYTYGEEASLGFPIENSSKNWHDNKQKKRLETFLMNSTENVAWSNKPVQTNPTNIYSNKTGYYQFYSNAARPMTPSSRLLGDQKNKGDCILQKLNCKRVCQIDTTPQ